MRPPARLARLLRDRRGATIVEFAMIAPVMALVLTVAHDLCYTAYVQAIVDGAVQKAGRDSAIQGGAQNSAEIDAKVLASLKVISRDVAVTTDRRSYASFSKMKPEAFTDANGNGQRDPRECFEDINGNKNWDADPGISGQGGANDTTKYTVTAKFGHLNPLYGMLGLPNKETLTSTTILKNQPYASQSVITPATVCT